MPTQTRLNPSPQFAVGACLVVFGILLSLDRLQLVDASQSLRFWPIVLLVLGVWMVIDRRESGWSLPGMVLIIIGGLLLLNTLGVVRVRFWELFWPLLIVLIGIRLIMQTLGRSTPAGASTAPTSGAGAINLFTILGGSKRANNVSCSRASGAPMGTKRAPRERKRANASSKHARTSLSRLSK